MKSSKRLRLKKILQRSRLLDMDTPLREFTKKRILEVADVDGEVNGHWFQDAYREAYRQLTLSQRKKTINPPSMVNARVIPGGWVDIDDDTWDLRPAGCNL